MFRSTNLQICWRTVELLGKPSVNPKWFGHIALVATYSTKTSSGLPKYSVPTLRHTVSHFVKFARPLQGDHEYHHTLVGLDATLQASFRSIVQLMRIKTSLKTCSKSVQNNVANKFMDGGEGEKLQSLLEDRAANTNNWLTPWWIDVAYLKSRDRLPATTSSAILFPRWNFSGSNGQIDASAKLIQAALKFYLQIVNDQLPQDTRGKIIFDMKQYKRLFGTTRLPRLGKDELRLGGEINPRPRHVIVMRNGHIFRLSVFDSDGHMRSLNQLKDELSKVIYPLSEEKAAHPVGILTSETRDIWSRAYSELQEANPEQLRCIEDALFVICLDKKVQESQGVSDLDAQALQCLHGGGCARNSVNRWFDKTLQFIVGVDGYCGINFEHAPVDAPPLKRLLDFICDQFNLNAFETEDATSDVEPSTPLNFSLSGTLCESIVEAGRKFDEVALDTEVKVFTFDRFGRDFPRHFGVSPDSMIQLAMQLAYYRVHRQQPSTNQTVTLRQFENGRTATVRLPNFQTAMFTHEMTESEDDRPGIKELAHMFQVAAQQHRNYSLQVLNGQGMDRHLLGLRLIAEEHGLPTPEIFRTDAYKKMMHFDILSCQLPTRHFLPMCYNPPAPDCYAVCYNHQESEIYFTVTTSKSCEKSVSSYRFSREITDALIDIRSLLLKHEELLNQVDC